MLNFNVNRVLCSILIIEKYSPKIECILVEYIYNLIPYHDYYNIELSNIHINPII